MVVKKKEHIDDVQPKTVDDHFELIMNDKEVIDEEPADLSSEDLPECGQEYYKNNKLAFAVASLTGVMAVLSNPDILKILIYTKQSGTQCTAFRRYLETLLHMYTWYTCDVTDITSRWYKSLNTIRWKHSSNSKRSRVAGYGAITQRDMVLTQFGFFGFILVEPKKLGILSSPEELEGINHYWRVFGHMIGISDRFNLCRKNAAETTKLCYRIQREVYRKYFENVSKEFEKMCEVLVNGLWITDLSLDYDALMYFTYSLVNVPYKKPLGLYSWLNHKYRVTVLYLCSVPIIGYLMRTYFNYFLTLNYWLMENFPILPIIRFGRKESRINLYPKYH
ncbi:uncharacterized protein LOC107273562 isoform X2 [Cephus cinctus]|uniref:Uncharacterized protein LOC107273562 isoform X2 n=1 Tax=Cephus cinctus TaxID=211228 RepID=A0AAJ7CCT7_CEPCN|nr:uncharacterized protein LOC107273562 isoform X2 [Cephus cinctus]